MQNSERFDRLADLALHSDLAPSENNMTPVKQPTYAASFRCIGSRCEDPCCADWDIPLDKTTYASYQLFPLEKAQQKHDQEIDSLRGAIPSNLKDAALEGGIGGAAFGCKAGGLLGMLFGPEVAAPTCAVGALAGAIDGAGAGMVMSLGHTILKGMTANEIYENEMQKCKAY